MAKSATIIKLPTRIRAQQSANDALRSAEENLRQCLDTEEAAAATVEDLRRQLANAELYLTSTRQATGRARTSVKNAKALATSANKL